MEFKRNLTLLTDFYELTMMNGYLEYGMADNEAVFDLFFRENEESDFCIVSGLQQAIEYVKNLHFDEEDIDYLRKAADSARIFSKDSGILSLPAICTLWKRVRSFIRTSLS